MGAGETISELLARFAEFEDEYLRERPRTSPTSPADREEAGRDDSRRMADIKEGSS